MNQSQNDSPETSQMAELDQNMYVVEKILKKRTTVKHGKTQVLYYVRWEGYPRQEDHTWEPLSNLASVPALIEEFQAKLASKKKKQQQESQQNEQKNTDKRETIKQATKQNASEFRRQQHEATAFEQVTMKKSSKKKKFDREEAQVEKSKDIAAYDSENEKSQPLRRLKRDTTKEVPKVKKEPIIFVNKEKEVPKVQKEHIIFDNKDPVREKTKQKLPQKSISKVLSEPKELLREKEKPISYEKIPAKSQKPLVSKPSQIVIPKPEGPIYGKIVNHLYNDKQLSYEVQVLDTKGKMSKVQQLSSQKARVQCMAAVNAYLEHLLTFMEQARLKK